MLLLGKRYLGKNNYNNVTSVEYCEHSFVKKTYLNLKESEQRFVDECFRGQTDKNCGSTNSIWRSLCFRLLILGY